MITHKRVWVISLAIPAALLVLFFATATYGADRAGIHYISRSPILAIEWGPRQRFIVQDGLNIVSDRAPHATSGNFIEFSISADTRVSLRLFSVSWFREALRECECNHRKPAQAS
jgi:hypothetical protein